MKSSKQYHYILLLIILFCFILFSCRKPEKEEETEGRFFDVWVLNEGVWNMNNSSITAYNTTTNEHVSDLYAHANTNRRLGDVANDMLQHGSKVYVVVSMSNQIDVLDAATGRSLKQIPLSANGVSRQPRQLACHKGKVYVCCFDGTVVKLDTTSLSIEATVKAGRNPDGICVANTKLYVSNSGGLDYPNYDNTVSVFDLNTFTEIKKIKVGINPGMLKADAYGNVYLVSKGNYEDIPMCLQRIESATDEVVQRVDIEALEFDIYADNLYLYTYNYSTESASFQVLDTRSGAIVNAHFITDDNLLKKPYGINVNPYNGDVYITDALDYTSAGDVYCFDSKGNKKFQFEAGLMPKKIIFMHF
jgi:YVTN family beta-propeller protein